MNQLPFFEEDAQDIPTGYGIEQSHDGGFYPYRIDTENTAQIAHLKDEQGLDLRYASRNEALNVIMEQAIFKAAQEAGDDLVDLLDKAIEHMSEKQANRLLDKVHQIQSEAVRDIRGWK